MFENLSSTHFFHQRKIRSIPRAVSTSNSFTKATSAFLSLLRQCYQGNGEIYLGNTRVLCEALGGVGIGDLMMDKKGWGPPRNIRLVQLLNI